MKIGIIVLNYNGLANTLECLDSIKHLNNGNNHVKTYVVDNNSNDGSQEALEKLEDIDLTINDQNLGYSAGNNVAVKKALRVGTDFILVLNNDTICNEDLLINLVKFAKKADILSPKIYFAKGHEFHKDRYRNRELGKVVWYAGGQIDWQNIIGRHNGVDEIDRGQFAKNRLTDLATGACMFISRRVFEKIGYFDEKYFLYLEDMDFCYRARLAGFKILFVASAILWHKNASSAGGSGSKIQDYYITRNRLLFAFKYASIRTKLVLLRQVLSQLHFDVRRKAFLDFVTFRFGGRI